MATKTTRPTVREIASRCGVSAATVSRVLNANYKHGFSVRKDLHEQITRVAEEMGYRPNLAARNLVQQQTHIVALLGLDAFYDWPLNVYKLSCETAIRLLQKHGYNVCTAAPNPEKNNTELPPWRVDGVIVVQECSSQTIDEMERIRLPYVVINGPGGPNASSVVKDEVQATKHAISHLLDLGHQRIAYAGPSSLHRHHAGMIHRHNTYLAELKAEGLEPVSGHDRLFASGKEFLVSAVLEQKATAIIAYDYIIAMKILHAANGLNIEFPRQVSLVCLNDEKLCDWAVPPLTAVGVPSAKMGQMAAEMLLEKMKSPRNSTPECIKFVEDLVIRSSTAKLL